VCIFFYFVFSALRDQLGGDWDIVVIVSIPASILARIFDRYIGCGQRFRVYATQNSVKGTNLNKL